MLLLLNPRDISIIAGLSPDDKHVTCCGEFTRWKRSELRHAFYHKRLDARQVEKGLLLVINKPFISNK